MKKFMIMVVFIISIAYSKIIRLESCSHSEVLEAYIRCNDGDTIKIPEDTVVWKDALNLNKGITLMGAGINKTWIKWGGGDGKAIFIINPSNPQKNDFYRITGFTIDGDSIIDTRGIYIRNKGSIFVKNIRIDNNKIINCIGYGIETYGSIYGLIDNNIFTNNPKVFRFLGDNDASWAEPLKVGCINYLYIESNTIATGNNGIVISSGWGTRWVFRYNKVDLSERGFNIFDAHGNISTVRGNVGHDIYENNFINTQARGDGQRWHDLRGGTAHIYNNTGSGKEDRCGIAVREEDCASGAKYRYCLYPGIDPIKDTYIWNNIYNESPMRIHTSDSNDSVSMVMEDVDWWDDYGDDDNNFTFGPTNKRPQNPKKEDCYWDTDTKILYRSIEEGKWTKVYQEFRYPHPFRLAPPLDGLYGD